MRQTIIISIISLFVLLLSQGYWLHTTYQDFKEKKELIINELFDEAIDNEAAMRFSNKPKDPTNLHYTFKRAKDMTAAERNKLKGDSIYLNVSSEKNIGKSLSDIFVQKIQDELIHKKPLRLEMLDTLFANALIGQKMHASFALSLYDQNHQKIKQIEHAYDEGKSYILTTLKPIGTEGLLFAQAKVRLLPYSVFRQMLYAFIVSFLIICIMFYCIGSQLLVIRRTRRLLKEREEAVYSAIHDLKKPLNGMFSLLDFIQTTVEDSHLSEILKNQKSRIRKLSETIEAMLGDITGEYQTVFLQLADLDLPETIRQIERELNPLFKDKPYTFRIQNPDHIRCIRTDAVRLERCLRNLIENALKYSDPHVIVEVALASAPGKVGIAVRDNGWGIPLKAQKKVGKQFFRIKHTDKPRLEGYGIGLNSVRRLVKELHGKFSFESKEGVGSVFFINLSGI